MGSAIYDDSTIDPADYANSEGNPDNIVGHVSCNRTLWMFNTNTIECYYNSGAVMPFERISGACLEFGCAAAFSIVKMNNSVFWLGGNTSGTGQIFTATGLQPQAISTRAVDIAIQGYATTSDAVAYSYQQNGHHFYVINFPTANTSWAFDTTTSLWHERAYTNNGVLERHRANSHSFGFGKHLVGDYANGNIYILDENAYLDNGVPITRERTAPHMTQDEARLFYNSFQLDMEVGVGLDGITQGTNPQVMLTWSDDGGHSWSNEKWTDIGKIGERRRRALWRRLGTSRDRVFRVVITDPVKVTLIGAEVDAAAGVS